MSFRRPFSARVAGGYSAFLILIALLTLFPWRLVAAQAATEPKAEAPATNKEVRAAPTEKSERGRFVSFEDGLLTIQANSGDKLTTRVTNDAKILLWNDAEKAFKAADANDALSHAKAGDWFHVISSPNNLTIRIGSRKGTTIGTFVSYKDDRLLILGKNLGETFTKKYGNNVHFNKFRDDVPVYESIDGGEYKLIGTPKTALSIVKEGTILTVHGEGDDNIVLIQIGVPKKE